MLVPAMLAEGSVLSADFWDTLAPIVHQTWEVMVGDTVWVTVGKGSHCPSMPLEEEVRKVGANPAVILTPHASAVSVTIRVTPKRIALCRKRKADVCHIVTMPCDDYPT